MHPFRKARLHRLALLRACVIVVRRWDRTWGTPFFGFAPSALYVLNVLMATDPSAKRTDNMVAAGAMLQLVVDKARKRQRIRPNLQPVYAFFRQHNLSANDPYAYPIALAAAETVLMRERILVLLQCMDRVFPGAGFAVTTSSELTSELQESKALIACLASN